jgi:streptomycin 6-kinase
VVSRLETTAREVAAEWGLRLGTRILEGRYSYVAFAGDDAILKVIPKEDDQAAYSAEALEFWDGDGAVRLLRRDAGRGVLLLERVRPGTDAAMVDEDEGIAAAISVGRRIWRTPPSGHPFRRSDELVKRCLADLDDHPLRDMARAIFDEMTPRADVLVHADLHHHNLLLRGSEWVAIDPQPFIGEPEFDVPSFLWNPLSSVPTPERTHARIRGFATAGLDPERIRQWTLVRGICSGLPPEAEDDSRQLRVVRQLL